MKKSIFKIIRSWVILLLILTLLIFFFSFKASSLVFTYAKSKAETIILDCVDTAVIDVMKTENITYKDISNVTKDENGNFLGIEIDSVKLNLLKSLINKKISELLTKREDYKLFIPIGNFFASEYTSGLGPEIKFSMRVTETSKLNCKSKFSSAGINQTLHQIIISADISANILLLGRTDTFKISTSIIAAQTVIVGVTPQSFTNVTETPGSDIADEIFNFSDVK